MHMNWKSRVVRELWSEGQSFQGGEPIFKKGKKKKRQLHFPGFPYFVCFTSIYTFALFNKSWHILNVVNMYWTASAIYVMSFCKASLGLRWLTCMDVQTRWSYMDVETRNICFCDHDQKMWFRYYTECIPFGFYVVSRQQPPNCKWLRRIE